MLKNMSAMLETEELIVGRGWLVAHYPRVQCAFFGNNVDDASFDDYLEQLVADIDSRSAIDRVGVLYYAVNADMDSSRRRRMAKILDDRKQRLTEGTAAYALATNSAFVRGILTTLFWLAPPGYPYKVTATPLDGLQFIAERVPGIDPHAINRSFLKLLASELKQAS